jgi:hypothetical protein
MTHRKDLNRTSSTAVQGIEQASVKALREEDVCGDSGLHTELEEYNRLACDDFV